MDIPETTLHFRAAFNYSFKHSTFKNKKAVAEAARVSPSTISEIMTKRSYGPRTQTKIARALGYDLIDFLTLGRKLMEGEGKIQRGDRSVIIEVKSKKDRQLMKDSSERFKGVPLYESGKLAAGENGLIFDPFEEPASTIIIDQKELAGRRNHNLMGLRVGGSSMTPAIPPGSSVVIDLDDRELKTIKYLR
jgi:transcriptional regulator with XRE-family HTH domain